MPRKPPNHLFALLFIGALCLMPQGLLAQAQDPLEQYFSCILSCSQPDFDDYFDCLSQCNYKPSPFEKNPPQILHEPITSYSEVVTVVQEIVAQRELCYSQTRSLYIRLRSCRKEYTRQTMELARRVARFIRVNRNFKPKRGNRELGEFVLCIRVCPIARAKCQGELQLGKREESCEIVEYECLQQCFLDHYL